MRTTSFILTLLVLLAAGLRAAPSAVRSPAPKKTTAKRSTKPTARKISAKRITPKRKAAPKRITPVRRATAKTKSGKSASRKITARKIAPKRIAPSRRTARRRGSRVRTVPVKFTPGERTLSPISCATKETAPDSVALCTDCPDHALSEAYALIGLKYKRGGTSQETGMDCSGFTQHVYRRSCNLELPRSASQQFEVGQSTDKEDLIRGDLVFFKSRRGWHVGIYTGDGNFIHSPNRRSSVKISSLNSSYYKRTYLGARRLTQNIIEPLSIQPLPVIETLPDTSAPGEEEEDEGEEIESASGANNGGAGGN